LKLRTPASRNGVRLALLAVEGTQLFAKIFAASREGGAGDNQRDNQGEDDGHDEATRRAVMRFSSG